MNTESNQAQSGQPLSLQRPGELNELIRLEKKYDIGQILKTNPTISPSDGTMMHWLSNVMLHAKDKKDAVGKWRAIGRRNGRNSASDFSPVQQEILALPGEHVESLFEETQEHLVFTAVDIKERVINRIEGDQGHQWNDRYEVRQDAKRSLELLREFGISICVKPEDRELLQREHKDDVACPIIDRVKNKRIVSINGFSDSKVALTIHDTFDHFWMYDQLETAGVLERYNEFLQSVGNPQDTDMFNREGELIASVGFEWRSSHTQERDFMPLFNLNQIRSLLTRAKNGKVNDNQQRAAKIVADLREQDGESVKLCSVYSGILVELMEQRRKHGFIRLLDNNTENFSLIDPEYLALIVEINHFLCDPQTNAQGYLYKSEAIVEDYLIALARNDTSENLSITIQDIEHFDPAQSRISEQRQQWLLSNPFHAATRVDKC